MRLNKTGTRRPIASGYAYLCPLKISSSFTCSLFVPLSQHWSCKGNGFSHLHFLPLSKRNFT